MAYRGPLANDAFIALVTLLWLGMYSFATVGLFAAHGINWATWLVRYRLPLICLLAGSTFSIAWSIDTNLSIERCIHLVGSSLVALYIGFTLPLKRLLTISGLTLGALMTISALAAILIPELGLEFYEGKLVWMGVLASKNTLGFWSAISILLLISLSLWPGSTAQRLLYVFFTGMALLCLYFSQSATSLLSLITASIVMLYLYSAFSLRMSMLAMLLLGALAVTLIGIAFYFIDTAELIGRSGDLTGRADVWAQTWQVILDRPLTGFGYGTIWYPTEQSLWIQKSLTDFTWTVFHAHNGLLQLASEIGLPLTALALVMIVQQLVELIYCQYQRQQMGVLFVLGFMVALLVSNYSEARLLVNRELYWIFFIALPISMLQQVSLVPARHMEHRVLTGNLTPAASRKLRMAREKLVNKRSIKNRLQSRKPIKLINNANHHEIVGQPASRKKNVLAVEAKLHESAHHESTH